jgi:hypothetical protein
VPVEKECEVREGSQNEVSGNQITGSVLGSFSVFPDRHLLCPLRRSLFSGGNNAGRLALDFR